MPRDAIVVLGGGVYLDGTLPGIARRRVERAVDLFNEGLAGYLVMSGYRTVFAKSEPVTTEAGAMRDYALSLGVPEESIILEERARTTLGNAFFTKRDVLKPRGWTDISVVTSDYHVERAEYIFQRVLGPSYGIDMVPADSGLSPSELEEKLEREEESFRFWKRMLGFVPPGWDWYVWLLIQVGERFV